MSKANEKGICIIRPEPIHTVTPEKTPQILSTRFHDLAADGDAREPIPWLGHHSAKRQEAIYMGDTTIVLPRSLFLYLGIPAPVPYLTLYTKHDDKITQIWVQMPYFQSSGRVVDGKFQNQEDLDTTVAHELQTDGKVAHDAARQALRDRFTEPRPIIGQVEDIGYITQTGFRHSKRYGPENTFEPFLISSLAAELRGESEIPVARDRRHMFHPIPPTTIVKMLGKREFKKGSAFVLAHCLLKKGLVLSDQTDQDKLNGLLKEYEDHEAMETFPADPETAEKEIKLTNSATETSAQGRA